MHRNVSLMLARLRFSDSERRAVLACTGAHAGVPACTYAMQHPGSATTPGVAAMTARTSHRGEWISPTCMVLRDRECSLNVELTTTRWVEGG